MTRIAENRRYLGDALRARARQASPRTALRRFGHSVPIAIAIGAKDPGGVSGTPTGEAGVPNLSTHIAIASVALCIFCIVYFGLQLLRGAF